MPWIEDGLVVLVEIFSANKSVLDKVPALHFIWFENCSFLQTESYIKYTDEQNKKTLLIFSEQPEDCS